MLINGFTNEGDTILDLFGGSGSTGIASDNTKRKSICFELNYQISEASRLRSINNLEMILN
jgi:DNA modification methylase